MKLDTLLTSASVIPLTIGLIVCVVVSTVPLFSASSSWQDTTATFTKAATLQATNTRVTSLVNFVDANFGQTVTHLQVVTNYSIAALFHSPELPVAVRTLARTQPHSQPTRSRVRAGSH
jgi:hypothetical protein